MKRCSWCNKEYPDEATVCAIDQQDLEQVGPVAVPASAIEDNSPSLDESMPSPESSPAEVPPENADAPEGYQGLCSLDPFEVDSLLRKFQAQNIHFLIDRVEIPMTGARGIRQTALIEIYVRHAEFEKAMSILSADWKV